MFRNPRENASTSVETSVKPSTGRAPTPPGDRALRPQTTSVMTTHSNSKPLTPKPSSKSNVMLARQQSSTKKTPFSKTAGKPNTSILSFFKKVDSPLKDDSIFLSQGSQTDNVSPEQRSQSPRPINEIADDLYNSDETARFNEVQGSVKRRKTASASIQDDAFEGHGEPEAADLQTLGGSIRVEHLSSPGHAKPRTQKPRRTGPFLSDSDTETDDDDAHCPKVQQAVLDTEMAQVDRAISGKQHCLKDVVKTESVDQSQQRENLTFPTPLNPSEHFEEGFPNRHKVSIEPKKVHLEAQNSNLAVSKNSADSLSESGREHDYPPPIPTLKKEATSIDEWGQFEDLEDFPDDEFTFGEEFIERKWMEEQGEIEDAEAASDEMLRNNFGDDPSEKSTANDGITAACPICSCSLEGISPNEATRHVNGCLDGNPIPLQVPVETEPVKSKESKIMPAGASTRFARKSAIPRPGQANPFDFSAQPESDSSNVFSKLMSGKAEDSAWANAAAAENSSRGKPAYQRTCPFYKIMPGFFICVDAFRYGAVEGCNAYFLSHFHSDHYVGLSSSWCHGPIYCSKVTANLVKQQLRVDPKWVVPLEFEDKSDIPGTKGVAVTMIPANHCPGSSLFLFEKALGKGQNSRVQRVLHCGDFRACPEHITHPLLIADVMDSINGKVKQQKIDVCYLDTTYLNPRYAFPSQEAVIKACADMCVSLKKERADESDAWEVVKRQRAGAGMANFVTNAAMKPEDDSLAMSLDTNYTKPRGRLLVVCGTYSIGKERICMGIARALDCKIWAPPGKLRICAALEDPELMSRMTDDPRKAQIHMQMLMEIRAETLQEYLNSYKPHFSRIVGFRPSGWNYKPPNSRFTDSPSVPTILHSTNWRSSYSMAELIPQRGSTREASCFGVPYSEHSSFRELTMFVCALRIEKVVPTVNVGTAAGRAKMKAWIERWMAERRKNGVVRIGNGEGEVRW